MKEMIEIQLLLVTHMLFVITWANSLGTELSPKFFQIPLKLRIIHNLKCFSSIEILIDDSGELALSTYLDTY